MHVLNNIQSDTYFFHVGISVFVLYFVFNIFMSCVEIWNLGEEWKDKLGKAAKKKE